MDNNGYQLYEEFISRDNKKYLLTIEVYIKRGNIIYILTIYQIKRIFFKTKKIQILRTVACDTEEADMKSMIELGKHYINTSFA